MHYFFEKDLKLEFFTCFPEQEQYFVVEYHDGLISDFSETSSVTAQIWPYKHDFSILQDEPFKSWTLK